VVSKNLELVRCQRCFGNACTKVVGLTGYYGQVGIPINNLYFFYNGGQKLAYNLAY